MHKYRKRLILMLMMMMLSCAAVVAVPGAGMLMAMVCMGIFNLYVLLLYRRMAVGYDTMDQRHGKG